MLETVLGKNESRWITLRKNLTYLYNVNHNLLNRNQIENNKNIREGSPEFNKTFFSVYEQFLYYTFF